MANSVTETTVTAATAAGAAYEVKLNGVVEQGGAVPLAVGSGNVIAVVVTAQDGKMTQTYSVTVTPGRVVGRDAECAVAERGDVDAGVCVGDDCVHGIGGEQRDGDNGDGGGSCGSGT